MSSKKASWWHCSAFNFILALIIALGVLMENSGMNREPLGYVDPTGLLENPVQPPVDNPEDAIAYIAFANRETAVAALQAGEVRAVFILSADYPATGNVDLLYIEPPPENLVGQFRSFLKANLLVNLPPNVVARIVGGNKMTFRSLRYGEKFDPDAPFFGQLIPLLISLALIGIVVLSSGYLMDTVYAEKENRTFEVVSTSLSPRELIVGKVLGVVGIGFTIRIYWALIAVVAIYIGREVMDISWLHNPEIDWSGVLSVILVSIPSYATTMALMFTAGVLIGTRQESEQIYPLFFMLYFIPLYTLFFLGQNPNGAVAVGSSLAPFTCLMTLAIRSIFLTVPAWQVAASFIIQCLCAMACL